MSSNSHSLVKLDNTLMWNGKTKPFYEVYYIKWGDAQGKWSLWLRYTLSTSAPNRPDGVASVWAIFVDKEGHKTALKNHYDLLSHDIMHADTFIQIDKSYLSIAEAVGEIKTDKKFIQWNIQFEDPILSRRLYPYAWMYRAPFPKTKFVEPRFWGFASGTIIINEKKITVQRQRIHQAHLYGTELSPSWTWAHCIDFQEDSEAYFEGLAASLKIGSRQTRPLHLFLIGFEGKEFAANSFFDVFWQNRSTLGFESWQVEFKKHGYKFDVTITREPRLISGLRYDGPRGEIRYCYNSMMADIVIQAQRRKNGPWYHYKTLTSQKKCAFETVSEEIHDGVELIL